MGEDKPFLTQIATDLRAAIEADTPIDPRAVALIVDDWYEVYAHADRLADVVRKRLKRAHPTDHDHVILALWDEFSGAVDR